MKLPDRPQSGWTRETGNVLPLLVPLQDFLRDRPGELPIDPPVFLDAPHALLYISHIWYVTGTRFLLRHNVLLCGGRARRQARRLLQVRGIGPLTAVAIVATVGNARDFTSGRQFAAWLGLVPRQNSSGGKARLGHISRRGDAYLRMLLVQGARSVLNTAARHTDRLSLWALSLQARRGMHKALVGIAAKNARIAWALLSKDQTLRTV